MKTILLLTLFALSGCASVANGLAHIGDGLATEGQNNSVTCTSTSGYNQTQTVCK